VTTCDNYKRKNCIKLLQAIFCLIKQHYLRSNSPICRAYTRLHAGLRFEWRCRCLDINQLRL